MCKNTVFIFDTDAVQVISVNRGLWIMRRSIDKENMNNEGSFLKKDI